MSEAEDFAIWLRDRLEEKSCQSPRKIKATMRLVKGLTIAQAARVYLKKYPNCGDYDINGERCPCDLVAVAHWLREDGAITYREFECIEDNCPGCGEHGAPTQIVKVLERIGFADA